MRQSYSRIVNADWEHQLLSNIQMRIADLPPTSVVTQVLVSKNGTQALVIFNKEVSND